jgi:nitrate/nitrite-specific signal transduction histidine kinase
MRERSEKIGAQMNISSTPGSGTEIDLSIPAKVAYVELAKAKKPGS